LGGADDNPRYAAIDIGSHTIRLLVARLDENLVLVPLQSERRITRLAHQFQSDQCLKQPAIRTSMEVLREYADILASRGVRSVACGATGVVRRAADGSPFMNEVRACSGISGSILSESSEAFLSAKGVLSVLPRNGKGVLTFDLGGSTTEFLAVESSGEEPAWSDSVFVGASTISERFLAEAPPSADAVRQAREAVSGGIREVMRRCNTGLEGDLYPWELVGTAGTVTTLAAMHLRMDPYEPYRVNGAELTREWIEDMIGHLARTSLAERRLLPGLEEGREDIILGGALVVHEILLGLGRSRLLVTDAGLLEGLLLDLVERERFGSAGLRTPLQWRFPRTEPGAFAI